MFDTMRLHGLGTEEATRALVVSKAFQREAKALSMAQAIEKLVSKISLSNILYESDSSAEDASDDEEESLAIRSDLRINPVVQTKNTQQPSSKAETVSGRKRRINEAATPDKDLEPAPKKAAKHDASMPLAKRKADATTPITANEKPTTRPRADSLAEVVDTKMTAIAATTTTTASSRPKRHLRSGTPEETMLSEGTVDGASEAANPAEQRE